jgi:hypothetical protein
MLPNLDRTDSRTPYDGSGTGWITQDELLKIQKIGRFPTESVKNEMRTSSQWWRTEVISSVVMKEITLEGRLLL